MTITIDPRRIPRDTLQTLVNTYIDQLYAELDEAHATIARLSEENEGLKGDKEDLEGDLVKVMQWRKELIDENDRLKAELAERGSVLGVEGVF